MTPMRELKRLLVSRRGAQAGSVLRGCGTSNQGLRVRVMQEQPGGHEGPLQGRFLILAVGDNAHSDSLFALLNEETDANEVLRVIRQEHPACISVVNAHSLALDPGARAPDMAPPA